MVYTINNTNGHKFIELDDDGSIVSNKLSGIHLISKLTTGYGKYQSENFVHLAENFANIEPPEHPIIGQLWYNTQSQQVCICKPDRKPDGEGVIWDVLLTIRSDKKNANEGELYFDKENKELSIYNDGQWIPIGPMNYNNKRTISLKNSNSFELIPLCGDVNLLTLKIVAKEKTDKKPGSCASWIYKCLIQKNGNQFSIIGAPSYELIGGTGELKNAIIKLSVSNENANLVVDINTGGLTIEWFIDVEIVKV